MTLSKKAKEGLEWGVFEFRRRLTAGQDYKTALEEMGLKKTEDIMFFMEYLRNTGEKYLLSSIK